MVRAGIRAGYLDDVLQGIRPSERPQRCGRGQPLGTGAEQQSLIPPTRPSKPVGLVAIATGLRASIHAHCRARMATKLNCGARLGSVPSPARSGNVSRVNLDRQAAILSDD